MSDFKWTADFEKLFKLMEEVREMTLKEQCKCCHCWAQNPLYVPYVIPAQTPWYQKFTCTNGTISNGVQNIETQQTPMVGDGVAFNSICSYCGKGPCICPTPPALGHEAICICGTGGKNCCI